MTTTTSTTTSAAGATNPQPVAFLPAAVARMQPTPEKRALFADVLADARLSDYWPLLADMLGYAIRDIRTAHASECRRRGCRTCAALAEAAAWTDAHRQLDDSGCECNPGCGHRHHIPHPTRGFQP